MYSSFGPTMPNFIQPLAVYFRPPCKDDHCVCLLRTFYCNFKLKDILLQPCYQVFLSAFSYKASKEGEGGGGSASYKVYGVHYRSQATFFSRKCLTCVHYNVGLHSSPQLSLTRLTGN